MQRPSINYLLKSTSETLTRFPLACLSAVIGSFSAILLIVEVGEELIWQKIIMCSVIGLVAFFTFHITTENYKLNAAFKFSIFIGVTVLLIGYYFLLGDKITEIEATIYFVLNCSLHLLASFVLFIKNNSVDEFWNFNKSLFVRFLTSSLYSGVLFAGLSFALLAIDNLFNIDINYKIYWQLYVLIVGIFNTIFFLNGVPKPTQINDELVYLNGLKNFTQFVLIPLVIIYLIILLSYELKIIVLFDLPVGWVSTLILVFCVLGILSMLLVYPLRNNENHGWVKRFSKRFFMLILPLLLLLFWAIGYRINAYGFTVERYYVFILACWIAFITIYAIVKPNYHIKLIPMSLCFVGLISLFGPQSASSVAKYSQSKRLVSLIKINQSKGLSFDERKEITSVSDYLYDNYGANSLKPYFPNAFKNDSTDIKLTLSEILKSEKIESVSRYQNKDVTTKYFNLSLNNDLLYNNEGFDLMWMYDISYSNDETKEIKIDDKQQIQNISVKRNELEVVVAINNEIILLNWKPVVTNAVIKNEEPNAECSLTELSVTGESKSYLINMVAQQLIGESWNNNDSLIVNTFSGAFYLKLK